MMRILADATWLAVRALADAPGRGVTVAVALGVALGLPALTWRAGARAEAALMARASATPVVLGAPGDTFDLVFAALYFRPGGSPPLRWQAVGDLGAPGLLLAPMHVVHRADGATIVGTSPEYFEARGLTAAEGRLPAVLGEVVVGAEAAAERGLQPGHTLRSDLDAIHDLSGEAPLTLSVVGVLPAHGSADDHAVFTDVRTAWALDGSLHGHDEVAGSEALPGTTADHARASGAVIPRDAEQGALPSFHLHGEAATQPLTAILAFPQDARAHDMLLDRARNTPGVRAVRPLVVVEDLLSVGHRLRDGLLLFLALVGGATLALVALSLELSRRLRAREAAILRRLGAPPSLVPLMHGVEAALLLAAGGSLAIALAWAGDSLLGQALLP